LAEQSVGISFNFHRKLTRRVQARRNVSAFRSWNDQGQQSIGTQRYGDIEPIVAVIPGCDEVLAQGDLLDAGVLRLLDERARDRRHWIYV
jgi:hypothetical protein